MKKVIFMIGSIFPSLVFAGDLRQYNYVEASSIEIKNRNYSDLETKGFGVGGKVSIGDNFYLNGKYDDYSTDYYERDDNVERIVIGVGALAVFNELLVPYVEANYIEIDQSYFGETNYRQRYTVGISGDYAKISYRLGLNKYEASEDLYGSNKTKYIEAGYWVAKMIQLGLSLERHESSDLYELFIRYGFGD